MWFSAKLMSERICFIRCSFPSKWSSSNYNFGSATNRKKRQLFKSEKFVNFGILISVNIWLSVSFTSGQIIMRQYMVFQELWWITCFNGISNVGHIECIFVFGTGMWVTIIIDTVYRKSVRTSKDSNYLIIVSQHGLQCWKSKFHVFSISRTSFKWDSEIIIFKCVGNFQMHTNRLWRRSNTSWCGVFFRGRNLWDGINRRRQLKISINRLRLPCMKRYEIVFASGWSRYSCGTSS